MKNFLRKILLTLSLVLVSLPISPILAQEKNTDYKVATYIGGIGCSHCAVISPYLHEKTEEGDLIIVEYEIYQKLANATILDNFAESYGTSLGIPLVLFNSQSHNTGDTPIINNWEEMISNSNDDELYLPDGTSTQLSTFDLNNIKRYPRIYSKDRIAIRESITKLSNEQNQMILNFITSENIEDAIKDLKGKVKNSERVATPGKTLQYEQAVSINGWLLQWNGPAIESSDDNSIAGTLTNEGSEISFGKTLLLALADSINPCALSVLALMLFAIITYNPGNRKQILLSGLAFIAAVIIMYLFYGFLIIKAFQLIQSIATVRLYLYKGLGIAAMLLGLLELKDFFFYKPGGVATEMPLFLRPKVNKLISKITSPVGAFGIGLFVTLFLLPCTIGPYVILGGMVSDGGFVSALPHLILYNLVFVLPMLIVTLLIFFGSKRVEDINKFREKNVRKMHLIAGALIFTMGLLLLLGIF